MESGRNYPKAQCDHLAFRPALLVSARRIVPVVQHFRAHLHGNWNHWFFISTSLLQMFCKTHFYWLSLRHYGWEFQLRQVMISLNNYQQRKEKIGKQRNEATVKMENIFKSVKEMYKNVSKIKVIPFSLLWFLTGHNKQPLNDYKVFNDSACAYR